MRGYLNAYDLKTGKMVGRYSTGPDSEMLIDPNTTTTWADGAVKPVGADSSLKTWKASVEDRRRHLGLVSC